MRKYGLLVIGGLALLLFLYTMGKPYSPRDIENQVFTEKINETYQKYPFIYHIQVKGLRNYEQSIKRVDVILKSETEASQYDSIQDIMELVEEDIADAGKSSGLFKDAKILFFNEDGERL